MKVNRIDVLIQAKENTHRKYLYNEMLNMMNQNHFGGEFHPYSIKLSSMPEHLLKVLEELKIKFKRI